MSRFQPSASTNSISLKGSDTRTGDSIIIPIDISTLATTMSITRNGMKTMKPIWNAVLSSLVVGLIVSVLQAATQINEMTLTFIPKMLAMIVTLIVAGPWMITFFVDFLRRLYESIPTVIG